MFEKPSERDYGEFEGPPDERCLCGHWRLPLIIYQGRPAPVHEIRLTGDPAQDRNAIARCRQCEKDARGPECGEVKDVFPETFRRKFPKPSP